MDVSILVQIDFANRTIRAIDSISDIRNAVSYANVNLQLRHGVTLQCLAPVDENVIVEVRVPDEKVDNFSVGPHLRGISQYLLKTYGDKYRSYVVGKRFLQYTVLPKAYFDTVTNEPTMGKYEAVVAFISLLERHDSKAKESTEKIMAILMDADSLSDN